MRIEQEFLFNWQGIAIKVIYCPDYCEIFRKIYGYALAHIEVKAETPLPITETGYLSIWQSDAEVQQNGGVVAFVNLLMDTGADTQEWKQYIKKKIN